MPDVLLAKDRRRVKRKRRQLLLLGWPIDLMDDETVGTAWALSINTLEGRRLAFRNAVINVFTELGDVFRRCGASVRQAVESMRGVGDVK